MSIRNCHEMCYRDRDTNELFCPEWRVWVEKCPKESCIVCGCELNMYGGCDNCESQELELLREM